MQRVVLAVILREYPVLLTFPALACELFESPTDLVGGLALARAVRNLVEAPACAGSGAGRRWSGSASRCASRGRRCGRSPRRSAPGGAGLGCP